MRVEGSDSWFSVKVLNGRKGSKSEHRTAFRQITVAAGLSQDDDFCTHSRSPTLPDAASTAAFYVCATLTRVDCSSKPSTPCKILHLDWFRSSIDTWQHCCAVVSSPLPNSSSRRYIGKER